MTAHNPEQVSLDYVLDLVAQLSPEDQARLRRALLEDEEDIRIALQRLSEQDKRWTLEELEPELDLAG